MNLPSLILLLLILAATGLTIRKVYHSKGACEDCNSATCPVKGVAALENQNHDCCK